MAQGYFTSICISLQLKVLFAGSLLLILYYKENCDWSLCNVSGSFAGGNVGLAISQSLILTGMLQYGIQQLSEMCSQMISVERIIEYTDLPQEAALETSEGYNSLSCIFFSFLFNII